LTIDIGSVGEPALHAHAPSKRHQSLCRMTAGTTAVADFMPNSSRGIVPVNIHTSGLTVAVTQCTGRSPKQ